MQREARFDEIAQTLRQLGKALGVRGTAQRLKQHAPAFALCLLGCDLALPEGCGE